MDTQDEGAGTDYSLDDGLPDMVTVDSRWRLKSPVGLSIRPTAKDPREDSETARNDRQRDHELEGVDYLIQHCPRD